MVAKRRETTTDPTTRLPTERIGGGKPKRSLRTQRNPKQSKRSNPRSLRVRRGTFSVVFVLLCWEMAIRVLQPNSLIIVGPSAIFRAFVDLISSGQLGTDVAVSLRQFALGFGLAAIIGVGLGLTMGASKVVNDYVDPWLTALYSTPNIALAPLFIIWLGLGDPSHVAIVALAAFFPVIINTIAGVQAVHADLREVGIAYHANRRETFAKIDFPGAMPYIFTGLRLAVARALVGVVVADLFGATAGLGHLILNASQIFQTANVFVGVVVLAVLGVVITALLRAIEQVLTPWEGKNK